MSANQIKATLESLGNALGRLEEALVQPVENPLALRNDLRAPNSSRPSTA